MNVPTAPVRTARAPVVLLAAVFALSLAVLWIGAGPREITKTDEHRYITVARSFVATGDWLVCRLNGETYTHKPPGAFWAMALAHLLGAGWTAAAKIPSTLGAALAATLVFDLAGRAWGRLAAWVAAVALLTMKEFYTISIRGQLDPFLTLWTTLALYAAARAMVFEPAPARRSAWIALAWLAAGCGMMVKGPVAYVMTGLPVLAFVCWDRGPRALLTRAWLFAPLAILPGLIWALAAAGRAPEGWGYIRALALGHGVAHAAGQVDKLESWYFYLKTFPLGLLPWTFLLPAAIVSWRQDPTDGPRAADRFAMAWMVVPLVVMSCSPAKRDLYLLPVYPGVALLFGRLAATLARDEFRLQRPAAVWGLRCLAGTGVALGAACITAGAARLAGSDDALAAAWPAWAAARHRLPVWALVATIALGVLLAAVAIRLFRVHSFRATVRTVGAMMLLLTAGAALTYAPFTEALLSPREFLERVRAQVGGAWLGDYGGADYAANWICDRTVVPFVATRREAEAVLARERGGVYFLVEEVRLSRKGLPEGTRVVLTDSRTGEYRLLLLGRE